MPLYEYECTECGHRTEIIQRFDDPPLAACPECRGAMRRLISAPAFQFKGSGWYVTDYAGKKTAGSGDDGGDGAKSTTGSGEGSGDSETKTTKKKSSEGAAAGTTSK